MNDSLKSLMEEIEFVMAERKELSARGPSFRIVHRFRMPGSDCLPGEEIFAVFLVYRGCEYHLRLPLALRILFDYLARHSRVPQSASQIELGIRADDFYRQHAANGTGRWPVTRSITRSYVRTYAIRLRQALELAFQEANLRVDPRDVLTEPKTVGNEVGYQLRANCDWAHVDLTTQESQPLLGGNGRRRAAVTDFADEGV
jgi:hypothetical protein